MRGTLALDRDLGGWLMRTAQRVLLRLSAMSKAVVEPVERGRFDDEEVIDTRMRARRTWGAMTPPERHAFTHLHLLADNIRRSDTGAFAVRVRLASLRLGGRR